jgi:hypothetical protein
MVATLTPRVYTGSSSATESAAVTGIDWISVDNATNTSANRASNPIPVGTNSFEKHLRLKIDTAPATSVAAFKFWMSTSAVTNVALRVKLAIGTGGASPGTGDSTPTATTMTSDADAYGYTSGAKGDWDTASYSTINSVTKALLLQLQPNGSAAPGDIAQQTMNYQYDET